MREQQNPPAVVYLLRGADEQWADSCTRFIRGYQQYSAGAEHRLYVVCKGFSSDGDLALARRALGEVSHREFQLADDGFDLGAYLAIAPWISESEVCFLNTHSEILGAGWLEKLMANLRLPGVGLVGATGSYESLSKLDPVFPPFPNVHVRSNAFMITRDLLLKLAGHLTIAEKLDAYLIESGPDSLTRSVQRNGLKTMVVGGNGRGYEPRWWPRSDTFRQGAQANLMVADNQTRAYADAMFEDKRKMVQHTWGPYLQGIALSI
jgi:hypothetical protein